MKLPLLVLLALFIGSCNQFKKEEQPNTAKNMETVAKTTDPSASSNTNFGQAAMLIRKPISEVFEAFIDPEKTTKFWFTKSTGKLEEGKSVDWIWEMYQLSVPVNVKKIIENRHIQIEWGTGSNFSSVEWTFEAITENQTFVTITNTGLQGQGAHLMNAIRDSTAGFTMVLAGLKAYMEHGIELHLIRDKFPKH